MSSNEYKKILESAIDDASLDKKLVDRAAKLIDDVIKAVEKGIASAEKKASVLDMFVAKFGDRLKRVKDLVGKIDGSLLKVRGTEEYFKTFEKVEAVNASAADKLNALFANLDALEETEERALQLDEAEEEEAVRFLGEFYDDMKKLHSDDWSAESSTVREVLKLEAKIGNVWGNLLAVLYEVARPLADLHSLDNAQIGSPEEIEGVKKDLIDFYKLIAKR